MSEFTWLNKQGVQSDQGFILQFIDRYTAEYREGDKVITLDVESGRKGGAPCIILYPTAFKKWNDGSKINQYKQSTLLKNVEEALEFQNLKMVVEEGGTPK